VRLVGEGGDESLLSPFLRGPFLFGGSFGCVFFGTVLKGVKIMSGLEVPGEGGGGIPV